MPVSPEATAATRGSIAATVLTGAARALAFAFILIATRQLSTEHLARYSVVLAATTLCAILADFGTSTAVIRVVSREPGRAAPLLGGTLLASALSGAAAYGIGFAYFAGTSSVATNGDWAIGGLQVIGASVVSSLTSTLAGHGRLVRNAATQFAAQVTSFGGGAAVLAAGGTLHQALAALAAGPFVGIVISIPALRAVGAWPRRLSVDLAEVRLLLRDALPFAALAGMAALVSRADLLVLAVLSDSVETTRYELATRTVEGTTFVTLAVSAPTVFLLSRRLASGDLPGAQRAFDVLTHTLVIIGVAASVTLAPLATRLASFAYGDDYRSTGPPLALLGAFVWVAFLVACLGALLTSSEAPRKVVPLGATMLGINAVLVAALLPPFHAMGAAAATVGTQVVAVGLYARVARRLTGVRTRWPAPQVLVCGLVAAGVTWLTRDLALAVPIVLGQLTLFVGLVATRAMGRAEVVRLRRLLAR